MLADQGPRGAIGVCLRSVGRTFDIGAPIRAVDQVSTDIEAGSITALVGPSGSGKTTLLNLIAGLDRPTIGTVDVLGQPLDDLDDESLTRWRRTNVAFIFQAKGLVAHLTAAENVDMALRLVGRPRRERSTAAAAILERVGLADFMEHRPAEMSGGQQQRVAIARALVVEAPLLIADEPTGELDSDTGAQMIQLLIDEVRAAGTTALVATHDHVMEQSADRVLRLVDGRLEKTKSC